MPTVNAMTSKDPAVSLIAPGGAVLALAPDGQGALWLAAESGLWYGSPGGWSPSATPPPLPRMNALLALNSPAGQPLLLAGGSPATIVYSLDGGTTWHAARADEVEAPITCLAASPRFAEDRTLLAGTGGAGILRSTDGGRSWRLSSAGLQEFTVLALVVAPDWDGHETAFAVTEGGLYQTPNGGRYWRRVADCGDTMPLQALAVSFRFPADRLVYAGGDLPGVARSEDGGRSWAVLTPSGDAPAGVNCLLVAQGEQPALLAGTLDGAIYRSGDAGASWRCVTAGLSSVLSLGALGETIAAGLLDEGLLLSRDGGETWEPEAGLGLRDLTRLALAEDGVPLAFGLSGGIWRAEGRSWRRLAAELRSPLTTLLPRADGGLLLATAEALIAVSSGDLAEEPLPGKALATTLAARGDMEWLGDAAGALWRRGAGEPWSQVATLAGGRPVVALSLESELGIVAATIDAPAGRATLWRSVDGGATWGRWLEAPAEGMRVCLCPGEPAWAASGAQVHGWDGAAWRADEPDGLPVVALLRAAGGRLVVATAGGAYVRAGDGWERLALDVPPGGLLDLIALPSGALLGLGRGGSRAAAPLP